MSINTTISKSCSNLENILIIGNGGRENYRGGSKRVCSWNMSWGLHYKHRVALTVCQGPFCPGMKTKLSLFITQTMAHKQRYPKEWEQSKKGVWKKPWTLFFYGRSKLKEVKKGSKHDIVSLMNGWFRGFKVYCFTQDKGWLAYNAKHEKFVKLKKKSL